MNIFQAISHLKDSDIAIYTEEGAREICTALSVPYPTDIPLLHWDTVEGARHMLGFNALFAPGNGMYGYQLIDHIAKSLGLEQYDISTKEEILYLLRVIEEKLIRNGQVDVRHWWMPTTTSK